MTPGMREGLEGGPRLAAMVAVPGARVELCSGYDRDRCGLGEVKLGVGLLTIEAIEL